MAGGSSSRADGSVGAAEAASKLERAESPKARRGCAEDQSASLNAPRQGGPQGRSQWQLGGLRRPVGEARCGSSVSHSVLPNCLNPVRYSLPGSSSWDSPGKNIGVDCRCVFQRIFPTQGLLHCRQILYHLG